MWAFSSPLSPDNILINICYCFILCGSLRRFCKSFNSCTNLEFISFSLIFSTEFGTSVAKCQSHKDQKTKYLCVSHDSKICAECRISEHNDSCHVIEISPRSVSDEISTCQKELIAEMENAKALASSTKKLWEERNKIINNCRQDARRKIVGDSQTLIENVKKDQLVLVTEVDKKEMSDKKQWMTAKTEILKLEEQVDEMNQYKEFTSRNALQELRSLAKGMKEIKEIQTKLELRQEKLNARLSDRLQMTVPNDGMFGVISESTLIGSAMLSPTQVLHIYDNRQITGNVRMTCVSVDDTCKESWKHTVNIDNQNYPVVMSNLTMYYGGRSRALFAVGNKVFIVLFHQSTSEYDKVESVSTLVIGHVPEGSWITSITAHFPSNDPNQEFLISTSCDHILREYNLAGSNVRVIDATHLIPCNVISKVAYFKTAFAVIVRGKDDAIMLLADGKGITSGSLKPKKPEPGMVPINVIWTGVKFLVLYLKAGVVRDWKVICYSNVLGIVVSDVCYNGKAIEEKEVPVSLCRREYTGYVSLANSHVIKFEYPSLEREGFNLSSLLPLLLE